MKNTETQQINYKTLCGTLCHLLISSVKQKDYTELHREITEFLREEKTKKIEYGKDNCKFRF